ncbi:MAG: glutamate formiminotransferase [Actinomycetota bacterium]|nr:glutamate formiminotransferase [Actinomycetota bacterium]
MTDLLVVPNVSEGRDGAVIDRLAAAFSAHAHLLDTHSDEVHNRTVFTLAPSGEAARVLIDGAAAALDAIEMATHEGEHPCIGALDVAPAVWLDPADRERARAEALAAAEGIGELGIPVFLYGELASADERRERALFRRGGLAELRRRMASGDLAPDLGPATPHPSAGATLVTARPPLAAFNLELDGASLAEAQAIAAALRESGGGLPSVRAIGLAFDERTQVSTNVHDPIAVPLAQVVARVSELVAAVDARVVSAEIVGLVPRAALEGFPADVPLPGFDPATGVIENRTIV